MSVVKNFQSIQENINTTFKDFFIAPHPIEVVAISKRHSATAIRILLEYGHRAFGENRLQEAQEKWLPLKKEFPDIKLHMVGSLQSNKLKQACDLFDVLENIDSKKHIDGLVKYRNDNGKLPQIFIQVNTGFEPQKSGVTPDKLPDLMNYARQNHIEIDGLMCLPPANELPVYHFTMLKNLAKTHKIKNTSMGMSADYKQALICKTDFLRIGTAIFGQRDK